MTWRIPTVALLAIAALGTAAAAQATLDPAETTGTRWALLIGVDDYVRARKLEYCGADAKALAARLVAAGFPEDHVVLLHDKATETKYRPVKANIEDQVSLLLRLVEKDDLVVLAFSGHGVHLDGKSYFCPTEAKLDDSRTLVSLDTVYERLQKCPAALKLILVDACRNDPRPGGQRTFEATEGMKLFSESLQRPPKGILLLNSCAPGEISWEEKEFGHGVFMHYVLEGLQGQADANRNKRVSLMELYLYVNDRTKTYVMHTFSDVQRPSLKGDIHDDFDLTQAASHRVITNSIGMKLALIPAGEFTMGASDSDLHRGSDELPQHRVRITKPFYLGVYEVTQAEYERVMGVRVYDVKQAEYERLTGEKTFKGPTRPVEVNWDHAVEFCRELSAREGQRYRLPSEAEWEYACRAGTRTQYYWGDSDSESVVKDYCWYQKNAREKSWTTPHASSEGPQPVGQKRPNAWGLYDISGNVWEWCEDWHDDDYYDDSPTDDPPGPSSSYLRVARGGGWTRFASQCRSTKRADFIPSFQRSRVGFRVALVPAE